MHVLYSYPDVLGKPGIGMTALQQVRGLLGEGVDVTLFCASSRERDLGVSRSVRTLEWQGRRIPHRALGVARAYRHHDRSVARALWRMRGEIDLVHCWPRACIGTARTARQLGVTSVREVPSAHTAYVYEVTSRESAALGMQPPRGHAHSFDAGRLAEEEAEFRACDKLLVPSAFSRTTFLARGVPADKLVDHRYGVDLERFTPGAGDGGANHRPFTAAFIGRCEPIKGLHHALEAWLRSGAAEHGRLIVCGPFVDGYRSALGRRLDHPSIEVRGFTPDPAAVMREADVLILPSLIEGSALVTYEAQACGCVPVVSDATGARCDHLDTGMVHPAGAVDTLTEHLARLSADPRLLSRLRRNVMARRHELSWEVAARELVAVYEQCLEWRAEPRARLSAV